MEKVTRHIQLDHRTWVFLQQLAGNWKLSEGDVVDIIVRSAWPTLSCQKTAIQAER